MLNGVRMQSNQRHLISTLASAIKKLLVSGIKIIIRRIKSNNANGKKSNKHLEGDSHLVKMSMVFEIDGPDD